MRTFTFFRLLNYLVFYVVLLGEQWQSDPPVGQIDSPLGVTYKPTLEGVTYLPTRGSHTHQTRGHLSPTLQGKGGWVYLIRSHLTPNGTRWCWKKLWLQVNCKKTSLCPIVAPGFDRTHSSVGGEHWTERTQEQRQMIGELRCRRYWVMIVW